MVKTLVFKVFLTYTFGYPLKHIQAISIQDRDSGSNPDPGTKL